MTIELGPITEDDLPLLVTWFGQPQVYRWRKSVPDLDQARAKYRPRLRGEQPTQLIDRLLVLLRSHFNARTPVSVTPEAENAPSRRILEKNGFALVDVFQSQHLRGRPAQRPTARYRRML